MYLKSGKYAGVVSAAVFQGAVSDRYAHYTCRIGISQSFLTLKLGTVYGVGFIWPLFNNVFYFLLQGIYEFLTRRR